MNGPLQADIKANGFGKRLRESHFMVDPSWTFVNHGAFGGAVRPAFDEAAHWRMHMESQPLRYFDRVLMPHMVHSCRAVAAEIGASATDVALIPNATTGLNVVFNGVDLNAGDRVRHDATPPVAAFPPHCANMLMLTHRLVALPPNHRITFSPFHHEYVTTRIRHHSSASSNYLPPDTRYWVKRRRAPFECLKNGTLIPVYVCSVHLHFCRGRLALLSGSACTFDGLHF
jgi:hypothetical protein